MPISEFLRLVAEMRAAQKGYFRTRSGEALQAARHLEHRVDGGLAELMRGQRPQDLLPLGFDEAGKEG